MREWIVIVALGIIAGAVGLWTLRRRGAAGGAGATPPSSVGHEEAAEAAGALPAAGAVPGAAATPALQKSESPPSAAGSSPLAVLVFEGAPGRVAVLRPDVVIGRHSEDDIRVPDVRVSRHHARLVAKRGGGFEIHNLTSVRSEPNLMLVNGEEREHADIGDGDVVTLGGVVFTFRLAA